MNMSKKILIIEDDVFLGDVLIEKFKTEGFDSVLSRDGAEGLQKIRDLKPDLVLLDIILPSMNGYEILEAKQKDPSIVKIPVIIISNSGQPVEISRALELGIKDYFIKAQFDPDEVMSKVKNFLSKEEPGDVATLDSKDKSLAGKKVFWVEDDSFLSDIITRKMAAENAILIHANNAEEALSLLSSESPDIIILDVLLPGVNGFELLEKIKADQKLINIPVILLSNLGQESDIAHGKQLGADRFLIKATLTLDEIVENIRQVLNKKSA